MQRVVPAARAHPFFHQRLAAAHSYPAFLSACVCPGNVRPQNLQIRTHMSSPSGVNQAVACPKRGQRGYGCGLPPNCAATHPTRARRWRCCKAKTHCVPPSEGCSSPGGGEEKSLNCPPRQRLLLLNCCRRVGFPLAKSVMEGVQDSQPAINLTSQSVLVHCMCSQEQTSSCGTTRNVSSLPIPHPAWNFLSKRTSA